MSERKVGSQLPKWRNVGYCEISSSGLSLRIKLNVSRGYFYVGLKQLEKVLARKKKTASVYVLEKGESEHGSF